MSISEEQLQTTLSQTLEGFKDITLMSFKRVLNAQEESLGLKHTAEINSLNEAISEQAAEISRLKTELESIKVKRLKINRLAFLMFDKTNQDKSSKIILDTLKSFALSQKRKRRMTEICVELYNNKLKKSVYIPWKKEYTTQYRAEKNRRLHVKVNLEVSRLTEVTDKELSQLRTAVAELSNDLRSETIAKSHLKYQYEQALLRGMSALNLENMKIQQNIIEEERELSATSKNLLFTPDRRSH